MMPLSLGVSLHQRKTRKRVFLEKMEQVVPGAELQAVAHPLHGRDRTGCPAFALQTMLHLHFMPHVAMHPGKRQALAPTTVCGQFAESIKKFKASFRAKGRISVSGAQAAVCVCKKIQYEGLAKTWVHCTACLQASSIADWSCVTVLKNILRYQSDL